MACWADTLFEVFSSSLFLHWALFQRGLSLFSLQWHLLAPLGHKDSTMRGSHQPQGSPSAFRGDANVAALHLLGLISSSCATEWCYKRQLKIILLICVPGTSEVKTWEYTFDLTLLCNLNLFLFLTLLTYYQENDYNLQRYTTIWIWIYGNDMFCLCAIMCSYNDRIAQLEHSCVIERLLS